MVFYVDDVDKTYRHLKQSPFSDRIKTMATNARKLKRISVRNDLEITDMTNKTILSYLKKKQYDKYLKTPYTGFYFYRHE